MSSKNGPKLTALLAEAGQKPPPTEEESGAPIWKPLLGAILVLDLAAVGLFVVYVERRDTASASPTAVPAPCPTPVETIDPFASPTPAVTLQISPAGTPAAPSEIPSFDPGVLEEGDHFGEGGAQPSHSPSPSRSATPSGSRSGSHSLSPSAAQRAPTSPDHLEAQVASAAPLPSSGSQESAAPSEFPSPSPLASAVSPAPLSTPTLGSPTPLVTVPIGPSPPGCPSPQITAALGSPIPAPTTTIASPSPSASALVHADTPYENATLGYKFSYPEAWSLRVSGSLTEVLNPSRQALVSFGRGPLGPLSKASDAYFSSFRERYRDFDPSFTEVETIDGAVARAMVGRATNEDGERLRFKVILIHAEDQNFAVSSFAALDISPSVQAALDEIIGSFELPPS